MSELRGFLKRLIAPFARRRHERQLAADIRAHIQLATDENIRNGMKPEAARREAQRSFGNSGLMKEHYRDQLGVPLLAGLGREIRISVRGLTRRPGFTAVAVLSLGLGIGVNTAVFSLIDAVLIAPLPYADAGRLATIWQDGTAAGLDRVETTPGDFRDWRSESTAFDDMAGYYGTPLNLTGEGNPERLMGTAATPNLFRVLGVEAALGRTFLDSEGEAGNEYVVVLSHGLWQDRFGADPEIVGRAVRLNGQPFQIIGVMPPGFQFPHSDFRMWVPFVLLEDRGAYYVQAVGRLHDGVSLDEAKTDMDRISAQLAEAYPGENQGWETIVVGLRDQFVGDRQTSLWILLAASGLVLTVASANVAGLLITRGVGRHREVATRRALGAGRTAITRQLVVEGLALSFAGGVLGVAIAIGTFDFLETLMPSTVRGANEPALNLRLVFFATAVSIFTGVAFSLAPLRQVFGFVPGVGLGTRAPAGIANPRSRSVLVAGEVALALVVVASAGLLVRTVQNLESVDLGFRTENVLTLRLDPFGSEQTIDGRRQFLDDLIARVDKLPGVESVGMTTFLPYTDPGGARVFVLEERPDLPEEASVAYQREITPAFFDAMGVPLIAGRTFGPQDGLDGLRVGVVSEDIAGLLGDDALGKRVGFRSAPGQAPDWMTIVGVVGSIRQEGIDQPPQRGVIYTPVAQSAQIWYFSPRDLVIRTAGTPTALLATVRREVWGLDPNQSISNVRTLDTLVAQQISDRRTLTLLFSVFSGLVLVLAAIGVYGLLAYVVTTRRPEFGVRMALGAERRDLAVAVARQGVLWVGAGLLAGLTLVVGLTRSLGALLYGVSPVDPFSLVAAVALLSLAAIGAAIVPVWRATRSDPMSALRFE